MEDETFALREIPGAAVGPTRTGTVMPSRPPRVIAWALGFGVVTFSLGILAAAYMGSFMRLSGDDYCFGAVIREYGFLQTQVHSYLDHPPYHGNRYSHTLVSGLASMAGPTASAALPALSLVGWVAAATWCGWQVARWARLRRPFLLALFGAVVAVFLTVYQAPDRIQSVYWRSANVPYLTPLALDWLLLGLVVWQARTTGSRPIPLAAILVLAFFVGGFSEAAAAFQMTWLILALSAALVLRRRLGPDQRSVIRGLAVAALGAGLSVAAHAASPFARSGLGSLGSHPPAVLLLQTAMRGGFGFLRETLQGLPLPTAVTLALGGVLGVILAPERETRPGRWQTLPVAAFFLLGGTIILAAAVLTPSLYAYSALPDARALLAARHAMVLAFLGIGLAGGLALGAVLPSGLRRSLVLAPVCAAAVVLLATYPVRGAGKVVAEAPSYRRWALAWDARHEAILRARAAGEIDLHIMEIDHIIPFVSELTDEPTFWYNECAAGYYGVRSITADLPGWDE